MSFGLQMTNDSGESFIMSNVGFNFGLWFEGSSTGTGADQVFTFPGGYTFTRGDTGLGNQLLIFMNVPENHRYLSALNWDAPTNQINGIIMNVPNGVAYSYKVYRIINNLTISGSTFGMISYSGTGMVEWDSRAKTMNVGGMVNVTMDNTLTTKTASHASINSNSFILSFACGATFGTVFTYSDVADVNDWDTDGKGKLQYMRYKPYFKKTAGGIAIEYVQQGYSLGGATVIAIQSKPTQTFPFFFF